MFIPFHFIVDSNTDEITQHVPFVMYNWNTDNVLKPRQV